jgi:hypothetical protein
MSYGRSSGLSPPTDRAHPPHRRSRDYSPYLETGGDERDDEILPAVFVVTTTPPDGGAPGSRALWPAGGRRSRRCRRPPTRSRGIPTVRSARSGALPRPVARTPRRTCGEDACSAPPRDGAGMACRGERPPGAPRRTLARRPPSRPRPAGARPGQPRRAPVRFDSRSACRSSSRRGGRVGKADDERLVPSRAEPRRARRPVPRGRERSAPRLLAAGERAASRLPRGRRGVGAPRLAYRRAAHSVTDPPVDGRPNRSWE